MNDVLKWYSVTGTHSDTVLSSRIRLARNIDGVPFPVRLNINERMNVCKAVLAAFSRQSDVKLKLIDMSKLYPYEAVSLAERHLISPEFASFSEGRILLLSEDEKISVMVNEDDHVRIQTIEGGLNPEKAYAAADAIDNILDRELHFAFDNRLGFLTQNPSDLGTGMRASVMLHLPALSKTGEMSKFASTVSKLGISVRGFNGDTAAVKGDIYRLGNKVSLGISESDAISNLKSITLQLATREHTTAEKFVSDISVRDRINRAMGLLTTAVLLTTDEMMEMLSWVRLGAMYKMVNVSPETVDELFITMQPATVNVSAGMKLSSTERDEIRAKTVREMLGA